MATLSATAGMELPDDRAVWHPHINPWLIAVSVILPTFMEVLDTSIANVALNHIAGSMSASYSEATWVLTSYLIANAIVLPLTAWLGNRFGRKRFLLGCIMTFTAASFLCGISVSLPMLLAMRVLQGLAGGGLMPISQAILMESFPPNLQGAAQGLFGLGAVVAPVVGPVIGGWLTDNYSWRWVFYINIPIGALSVWAVQQTVEDPPWVRHSDPGPLDVLGFSALAIWLGCQETFLDKGQENDWFSSRFICWMAALALSGFVVFIIRELRADKPMVDLRIFRERNFAVGTVLIFFVGFLLYGIGLATPQFLQLLMGYTALAAGVATSPLGLGAMISMILAGRLAAKMELRFLSGVGYVIFLIGAFKLSGVNLFISPWSVFWPQMLAGLSMGFLFIPVNIAATAPLRRDEVGTATGIINLMRNVGGSVGIAMVSTFLARRAQVHQSMMVQHFTAGNLNLQARAAALQHYMALRMPASGNGRGPATGLVYELLQQQTHLLAFRDLYQGLGMIAAGCLILVLALRRARMASGASVSVH
ncbi:MAG: DHA2 family efflux MFS transporter permease subunit [Acidobacteriota bacterium]|nr:DHA2 family efflux MFS transporter permease subunit [Acidobacteriota bacterium]